MFPDFLFLFLFEAEWWTSLFFWYRMSHFEFFSRHYFFRWSMGHIFLLLHVPRFYPLICAGYCALFVAENLIIESSSEECCLLIWWTVKLLAYYTELVSAFHVMSETVDFVLSLVWCLDSFVLTHIFYFWGMALLWFWREAQSVYKSPLICWNANRKLFLQWWTKIWNLRPVLSDSQLWLYGLLLEISPVPQMFRSQPRL